MKTKTVAVIPARYESTRLPGKPLREINGVSMIQRVYEQVQKTETVSEIYIATDDEGIFSHVKSFGGKAIMTSKNHQTGTDRILEVLEKIENFDIVLNVQGDEPLIDPKLIDETISHFLNDKESVVGTVATVNLDKQSYFDENQVKVVLNNKEQALYFSRSAIPFFREQKKYEKILGHIGIYVFEYDFLKNKFPFLEKSEIEAFEKLEQLRILDNGYKISVLRTTEKSIGVDTEEDLQKVEKMIKSKDNQ
jgi:3-deoxy-manno-octulosonate cytidylyltransferase (CMP-KDO synthetase)